MRGLSSTLLLVNHPMLKTCFPIRCLVTSQPSRFAGSGHEGEEAVIDLVPNQESAVKFITHVPVLAREVTRMLKPEDGQLFVDMTFGGGGHTRHLLSSKRDIRVIALDRDPVAYNRAVALSRETEGRVIPLLGRFSELPRLLAKMGVNKGEVNGAIMDLGASSLQFDDNNRGFAINSNGPLDMRMDGQRFPSMPTAADVVNTLDSESLSKIFKAYGEEKHSKKFSQAIIDSRFMLKSITTTNDLSHLINCLSEETRTDSLGRSSHGATKVFQAIRIFVNNELNELNYALEKIRHYLVYDPKAALLNRIDKQLEEEELPKSGRISVISFHSLEDRIVKRHLLSINVNDPISQTVSQKSRNALEVASEAEMDQLMTRKWLPINKHVVLPSEEEVLSNPRSRSAKLRTALRIM